MFYELLETETVARIAAKVVSQYLTEKLPENQADYNRPFVKGKITVAYKKSQFNTPKSTGHTVQEEGMQLEIVLCAKKLRGPDGIYEMFDKTRRALIGWRPSHCGRMYAVSFELETRQDGLFYYIFTVGAVSQLVMEADIDNDPAVSELQFVPDAPEYDTLTLTF